MSRKIGRSLAIMVLLLLSVGPLYARSSCSDLLRDGLFDTVARDSSGLAVSAFHVAMCDESLQITEQSKSSGGGGGFGIGKFKLSGNAASANAFRGEYRAKYCNKEDASTRKENDESLRARVANVDLANAFTRCKELEQRGLEFSVDVNPFNERLITISVVNNPTIQSMRPRLRRISWNPADGGDCTFPDLLVGSEIPNEAFQIVCTRTTAESFSVVVGTSFGDFTKHLRPTPPLPSLTDLDRRLAMAESSLRTTGEVLSQARSLARLGEQQPSIWAANIVRTGQTLPGDTKWQPYDNSTRGVFVEVDTSQEGFRGTPHYVASLHGATNHWETTGGSEVYVPTEKGFRIYVRYFDGKPITPSEANRMKWHIVWIAVEDVGSQ